MDMSEAIPILVVGFMCLIGFWLAGLTYLMFKSQKKDKVKEKEAKEEEPKEEEETKEDEELEPADEEKKTP